MVLFLATLQLESMQGVRGWVVGALVVAWLRVDVGASDVHILLCCGWRVCVAACSTARRAYTLRV